MDKKKVLIIDDEIDLCQLLRSYFQRKSYEVHTSHTLEEGLAKLDDVHPDIVFLDNNLPDGTGWNAAPEISRRVPSAHINLISAFHPALPKMPNDSKVSVIEKPISFSDLEGLFY